MQEYFVWARIQAARNGRFRVTVTAVPMSSGGGGLIGTDKLEQETVDNHDAAVAARDRMILSVGEKVRAGGGCVVSAEIG